jgi:RNA polymerase sigma factor (sigma-70 family)
MSSLPDRQVQQADEACDLLRRVAAGDAEALRELYHLYSGMVHGLALRMLRDRSAAEDVTQEVFLQLWLHASAFDPLRGSARAWIWSITRSRALDYLRRRSARRGAPGQFIPPTAEKHAVTPEDKVGTALSSLDDEQRRLVELSYYHGMSHAEIAALLGQPLGTVKTRIRFALQALRATLARDRPLDGRPPSSTSRAPRLD